jgi:hypothetical protein
LQSISVTESVKLWLPVIETQTTLTSCMSIRKETCKQHDASDTGLDETCWMSHGKCPILPTHFFIFISTIQWWLNKTVSTGSSSVRWKM